MSIGSGTTYPPGLYSPGTDQVAVATNGTGRLFVDASGNVGVNVASPASFEPGARNLVIGSGSGDNGVSIYSGTANQGIIFFADGTTTAQKYTGFIAYDHNINAMRFGTNDGAERLRITSTGTLNFVGAGTVGSTQAVSFSGSAPVDSLVIDSSGRLGIGTSSPGEQLDVSSGSGGLIRVTSSDAAITTANERIGKIEMYSSDASVNGTGIAAYIEAVSQAAFTGQGRPTHLTFGTYKSGDSLGERVRITDAGNVGIGTTAPTQKLQVTDGTLSNFFVAPGYNSGQGTTLAVGGGEYIEFATNGIANPRARIDSSGRLLVGTSTARVFDSSTATLTPITQIESTDSESAFSIIRNSSLDTGPGLFFGKSRSAALGGTTIVQNDDKLGTIFFEGTDGTNLIEAATISALVDGTPGANDMPGRLVFSTTADGASSPTERMRINSAGALGVGGANFGTTGQALISNGSSAVPTWQDLNTAVFGWDHDNDTYGLYLPGTSISTGSLSGTINIDVQSRVRRCVINNSGVVQYYLDANDSTKKAATWLRIVETESLATAYTGTPAAEATNSLLRVGVPAWDSTITFTQGQKVTHGGYVWECLTATTPTVTAGAFVVGVEYVIRTVGTTDFTLIGASANTVGVTFTATGVGTGTGTARETPQAGTVASVLDGTDGQVVVEVPAFSVRYGFINGVHTREVRLGCNDGLIAQGFRPHPAFIKTDGTYKSAFYWGAYQAYSDGTNLASVSGQTNTRSLTRATFRTRAALRGTGWHVQSYLELAAIQTLLVTEYRDYNSQKVLGNGSIEGATYGVATGLSNSRGNRSGNVYTGGGSSSDFMSYRGIENLYGRAWTWADGINVYERVVYLTNNQSVFADNTSVGYSFYAQVPSGSGSYQKELFPLADVFLPSVVTGASSTTYLADALYTSTGWRVAAVGGDSNDGSIDGAFALALSRDSGSAVAYFGARSAYAAN